MLRVSFYYMSALFMEVLSVVEHYEHVGVLGVKAEIVLPALVVAQEGGGYYWGVVFMGHAGQQTMVLGVFIFVAQHIIMKFSKTPSIQFFTSWYFIINTFLVISYPLLRIFTSVGDRSLRNVDYFGFTYQNSIIYAGLTFISLYYIRSSSLRQFILDCLSIGKICVGSLLFFAKIRLFMVYVGVCCLSWILLAYPRYRGKNKFIRIQSEEQFDDLVGEIVQKRQGGDDFQNYKYKDKKMFFIQFYADWLTLCNTSKQLWYEYSNRYSTPKLTFLQVNVSKVPQIATKFNINISGFTKQLPTVLILEDGEQTVRFPPIKESGKVDKIVKLDYKVLLKYFDLQSRYLETREKKRNKKQ